MRGPEKARFLQVWGYGIALKTIGLLYINVYLYSGPIKIIEQGISYMSRSPMGVAALMAGVVFVNADALAQDQPNKYRNVPMPGDIAAPHSFDNERIKIFQVGDAPDQGSQHHVYFWDKEKNELIEIFARSLIPGEKMVTPNADGTAVESVFIEFADGSGLGALQGKIKEGLKLRCGKETPRTLKEDVNPSADWKKAKVLALPWIAGSIQAFILDNDDPKKDPILIGIAHGDSVKGHTTLPPLRVFYGQKNEMVEYKAKYKHAQNGEGAELRMEGLGHIILPNPKDALFGEGKTFFYREGATEGVEIEPTPQMANAFFKDYGVNKLLAFEPLRGRLCNRRAAENTIK